MATIGTAPTDPVTAHNVTRFSQEEAEAIHSRMARLSLAELDTLF